MFPKKSINPVEIKIVLPVADDLGFVIKREEDRSRLERWWLRRQVAKSALDKNYLDYIPK